MPTSRTTSTPQYKLCCSCRRNYHKVAVREPVTERVAPGEYRPTGRTQVYGYCPSCAPTTIRVGCTLVYDRRGERTKAQKPITIEQPPAPETIEEQISRAQSNPKRATLILRGHAVWKYCLHPAELDINEHCLTCGADLS